MAVTTTAVGRIGETIALLYLKKRGYCLLERNYRAGRQEIDLILMDGDTIVFVEVKARSRSDYGTPAEAITAKKQGFLRRAALSYLVETKQTERLTRFDAAEVFLPGGRVHYIENAF